MPVTLSVSSISFYDFIIKLFLSNNIDSTNYHKEERCYVLRLYLIVSAFGFSVEVWTYMYITYFLEYITDTQPIGQES